MPPSHRAALTRVRHGRRRPAELAPDLRVAEDDGSRLITRFVAEQRPHDASSGAAGRASGPAEGAAACWCAATNSRLRRASLMAVSAYMISGTGTALRAARVASGRVSWAGYSPRFA